MSEASSVVADATLTLYMLYMLYIVMNTLRLWPWNETEDQ